MPKKKTTDISGLFAGTSEEVHNRIMSLPPAPRELVEQLQRQERQNAETMRRIRARSSGQASAGPSPKSGSPTKRRR